MELHYMIQLLFNVGFVLAIGLLWVKMNRPAKEDPRLSRGLQLLQTKIAILEDLSDRSEKQVKDLCNLMNKKSQELQQIMLDADKHNQEIRSSMDKSLQVAEIFEDKIPHEEIIERQNSKKYIKAARLAHQGLSIEEIADEVDLSPAEISLISKVNKDRLMFDEQALPAWANREQTISTNSLANIERDFSDAFEPAHVDSDKLKELGDKFRQACESSEEEFLHQMRDEQVLEQEKISSLEKEPVTNEVVEKTFAESSQKEREQRAQKIIDEAKRDGEEALAKEEDLLEEQIIKKVVFPKLDSSNLIG